MARWLLAFPVLVGALAGCTTSENTSPEPAALRLGVADDLGWSLHEPPQTTSAAAHAHIQSAD